VTVQSQTQEHMDALTAAVNGASAAVYSGCGAVDARHDRGHDEPRGRRRQRVSRDGGAVGADPVAAEQHSLQLELADVAFRVRGDEPGRHKRTLYLKKNGNVHADDHGALSESKDNLLFATGSIRCTMTSHSLSLVQTLRVSIPHTTVKQLLAREGLRTSSAFGKQT